MAGNYRLGRVLGFPLSVDASWLVLFFLILWSFTMGVFPAGAPGLSFLAYLVMGLAGTLLFFSSLVVHELAHAVVARMKGVEVEGITLFIFGGVARTKTESSSPGDEFQIAGVGPLASLVLAVVFWGLGAAAMRWQMGPAVQVVTGYLAGLNLALAIFNLLPGFPLDGGRLLRATVWKITGDMTKATRIAAGAGQVLAWMLVALGGLLAFTGEVVGGLWMAFIGWFLRNAARASVRQQVARTRLEGATAGRLMRPVVAGFRGGAEETSLGPETPLTEVIEALRRAPGGRVLVVEDHMVVGVVDATDVAAWMGAMQYSGRSGR